jgi:hypothetical protein
VAKVVDRTDLDLCLIYGGWMTKRSDPSSEALDLDSQALAALDQARAMSPGPERVQALKRAGLLRNEAEKQGIIFAKRGRPAK